MNKFTFFLLSFAILILSCKKEATNDGGGTTTPKDPSSMFEMTVPPGFNYETYRDVQVTLTVLNNEDKAGKNTIVWLFTDAPELGGRLLMKGRTSNTGVFSAKIRIPAGLKQLVCNTSMLGVPENIILNTNTNSISNILGGSRPQLVQTVDYKLNNGMHQMQKNANKFSNKYLPLGWNLLGVPNNLMSPSDVVSNQMINDIWAALPSRVSVPDNHPTWLDDQTTKRTLLITQTADVYVTFLTEGAGYKNTLFYYKYHKNNPPTNVAAIDSLYIIYPNASLNASGGGLVAGNKVFIGRVGPDTVIAYGIAANGFNSTNATLGNGMGLLFANKNFNPESNPNLRQHLVMLYDAPSSKFIMGFEDLNRSSSGCDHDFNDVLFYTTSNPINAISNDSIVALPPTNDGDGDGVNDIDDEYPSDPNRAFNNYYPAQNTYASVAFEDLWPNYGDYDMNDVVVDFNYKVVTNASNAVKDVEGKYVLRASGGQIENGFGVEFPTTPSNVSSITGATLEAGQAKAVVAVFNNIRTIQSRWNTVPGEPYADTVLTTIRFTLQTPLLVSTFGVNEYNPFIWGNSNGKNRGMEIHLPGKTPTSLASSVIFGTGDDRTDASQNKYYLSRENLPWAILTPERFSYPKEKADIVTAYLKFGQWAQSGGATFPDWYQNTSGYRNPSNIYVKP
jgi:LruC domain-containing protein